MKSIFVDFSEEEYEKYSELFSHNTELEDGKIRVWGGEDTSLALVKHRYSGDIYMEIEEGESDFFQDGDHIYLAGEVWWAKLNDLDQLVEDVKNGAELYYSEYE